MTQAERRQRTSLAITGAALVEFSTKGYEATTLRDIAARAGRGLGALTSCFGSKRALYIAVYGHPPISPEVGRRLFALVPPRHQRAAAALVHNDV